MWKELWDRVGEKAPLVHCITNYVTINDVANLLLACGASPIMADDPAEVEEITSRCAALTLNLGTLHRHTIPALFAAGRRANGLGHPVVLDPVGVGASSLRRETARDLLREVRFAAIRGNMSEIMALALGRGEARGVDAAWADAITGEQVPERAAQVMALAAELGTVVAVTGAIDLVADGRRCYAVHNGRPEMGRVTGTGCQLSALTAACLAANPEAPLEGAAAAVAAMGVAGELAWRRMAPEEGNSAYRGRIIDAIYHLTGETLEREGRIQIAAG